MQEVKENTELVRKINDSYSQKKKGGEIMNKKLNSSFDTSSVSGPLIASSGFAWTKRQKDDVKSTLSFTQYISTSQISALDSSFKFAKCSSFNLVKEGDEGHDSQEITAKHVKQTQQHRFDSSDTFDTSKLYQFYDSKETDEADALKSNPVSINHNHKIYSFLAMIKINWFCNILEVVVLRLTSMCLS